MDFWKALQYFAAALIFVLSAVYLSSWINGERKLLPSQQIVRSVVSCSPDFLSYQALRDKQNHVVSLIDARKSMFAANGEFVNSQIVITKNETEESKVACGYLFIRTGTATNGALQSWENLYINPDEFGGHIDSSNQFGPGDGRNYSEYLFSLNDIRYWKTRAERVKGNLLKADWATLLNVQNSISFSIALNTENKTGFIDEFSIVYKCWNPKTGEENDGCKINVFSRSDTQSSSLN